MIDISDGLSSELQHISNSSNLGFKIFEDKLPIKDDVLSVSKELDINYLDAVLNGGEEYELLFSIPVDKFESVNFDKIDISPLGHFTNDKRKVLVEKSGKNREIKSKGWDHF